MKSRRLHKRMTMLLAGWLAAGGVMAADAALAMQEVAPGNYVHFGRHVTFEDPQHDDIANIGFIAGSKCVAVVDTGGSIKIGRQLRQAVRDKAKLPVCYVINTHVHVDHVLGNYAFRDDKPIFIGNAALAGAMDANREFFVKNFPEDLGAPPGPDQVIGPDQGVENTLELDLGNKRLLLKAMPKAHTTADLTVLDESTSTLWTGDLLFRERIPSLDGSVLGWLKVIDGLKQQQVKLAIPGHGPVTNDLPGALDEERGYLQMLVDQVRGMIKQGVPMEVAMTRVGMPQAAQWQLWEQHHRRNVIRVFHELEWE
jgi:quinoprotein relay system zinc metallohydrolase 2